MCIFSLVVPINSQPIISTALKVAFNVPLFPCPNLIKYSSPCFSIESTSLRYVISSGKLPSLYLTSFQDFPPDIVEYIIGKLELDE